MSATQSPLKRWLILGGIVLLAHLKLLQSMPTDFAPTQATAALPLTFTTRSIDAPSAVAPLAPNPKARTPPPKAPTPPSARPTDMTPEPSLPVTEESAEVPGAQAPTPPPLHGAGEAAAATATPSTTKPEPTQAEPESEPPQPPPDKPLPFNKQSLSPSKKLIYTLKTNKFPFTLNAELLWRNQGDSYSARLRYSAFGMARVQTSQGRITDAGLAPERFSDKYRSEVAAHFNYQQRKITFSANTPDAPLLTGAQDRLSVLLQLGGLMASEPTRYASGSIITLQTVGARSADMWLFTVMLTETLELPGATVLAVKLERIPRELYDQKVEVWLAPGMNYLPVRIRITEANGDSADQQWSATESADGAD